MLTVTELPVAVFLANYLSVHITRSRVWLYAIPTSSVKNHGNYLHRSIKIHLFIKKRQTLGETQHLTEVVYGS
ncbi:MAG: hypothetical protein Q8K75_08915 [Chlamydiales bacterium]|nr:hypothetical protein [Chlamydiales bacterium]